MVFPVSIYRSDRIVSHPSLMNFPTLAISLSLSLVMATGCSRKDADLGKDETVAAEPAPRFSRLRDESLKEEPRIAFERSLADKKILGMDYAWELAMMTSLLSFSAKDFEWIWDRISTLSDEDSRAFSQAAAVFLVGAGRRLEDVPAIVQRVLDDPTPRRRVLGEVADEMRQMSAQAGISDPDILTWVSFERQLTGEDRDAVRIAVGNAFADPANAALLIDQRVSLDEWEQNAFIGRLDSSFREEGMTVQANLRKQLELLGKCIESGLLPESSKEIYLARVVSNQTQLMTATLIEMGEADELIHLPNFPELASNLGISAPESLGELMIAGKLSDQIADEQFTVWAVRGSVSAEEWLAKNEARLPEPVLKRILGNMAFAAAQNGHPDEARIWVARVNDPAFLRDHFAKLEKKSYPK